MQATIIGLSVGILFLIYLGWRVGARGSEERNLFNALGELALYSFAGLFFVIILFLLGEYNATETWYPVLRTMFIIVQIILGVVFSLGATVGAILMLVFGFMQWFSPKKPKKRYYSR